MVLFCKVMVTIYTAKIVYIYVRVLMTFSTSYCLSNTLMVPWNVCVCVSVYVRMYVCMCVYIHGLIQNFPDWCRHLHSSCVSAKHRQMVGQPCLASLRAKFHVGGKTWAVFTRVYLESCT